MTVVLPLPVVPTSAIFCPSSARKVSPSINGVLGLYEKDAFSNSMELTGNSTFSVPPLSSSASSSRANMVRPAALAVCSSAVTLVTSLNGRAYWLA